MHRSYFVFSAPTHYELGLAMGRQFAPEAVAAIKEAASHSKWPQHQLIAAKQLPFAKQYFPEYVAELKGYAEGAQVSFNHLWTISLEDDALVVGEAHHAKCTTIITNQGLLIGHSEDHVVGGSKDLCVVKKTIGGFSTLELFYYNTIGGSSIGYNSAGFVHAVNTLLYTRVKIGVPKLLQARFLLDSTDPQTDLDKVAVLPRTSGFSHTLVDSSGKIWNSEVTAFTTHFDEPEAPFCHTNHCLIDRSGISLRNSWGTTTRLAFATKHTKAHMTDHQMQELLLNDSLGNDLSLHNERSVGKMVVNLKTKTAYIWLLSEAEAGWVTYPL